MQNHPKSNSIATGLAMFSMFFGAGNVVFPLAVGQYAQDKNLFAVLGLLITAVGVPFLGLVAITLFDGKYRKFFSRLGKVPGFILALVIMGLIGPFGALPRCIALSYSTTNMFFPGISIELFSLVSSLLIFALTAKRNSIVDILGYFLTPLLLISLAVIIVKGLIISPALPVSEESGLTTFLVGLTEGYQTMDLLGAFFFASVVIVCLKKDLTSEQQHDHTLLLKLMIKASLIGAGLLAIVYIGFSFVAAFHSENLASIGKEELLGQIALHILGPYAGIVACAAVALACLTTAIALASVFAEFIHEDVSNYKIGYIPALVGTLIISYFVSIMNFTRIMEILGPVLEALYPALIVLSVLNLLYKMYHFKPIKVPVFTTFILTLIGYFYIDR
jgi:LIVCS family branched-chain amino acid:cation transporter